MPHSENKKNIKAFLAPLAFLVLVVVLIFMLSVFFNVSHVEVEGNNFYTAETVAEASGIHEGDNLFFINRFSAASRIFSRLPYVEAISIEKSLPGTITVHVTESEAIACIAYGDEFWAMDRSCKLLSPVSSEDAQVLLLLDGVEAIEPAEGEILRISGWDNETVAFVSDILDQIYALGLRQQIEIIDFSDPVCPCFDYLERFNVRFGGNENVGYKFQLLISVTQALKPGDCGTLDLSIDSAAHLCYD